MACERPSLCDGVDSLMHSSARTEPSLAPRLVDVVELAVELHDLGLKAGSVGAVVEELPDEHFLVEFSDAEGKSLALCTLTGEQLIPRR